MANSSTTIDDDSVRKYINWNDLLQVIETAFGNFSRGKDGGVVQPVRSVVPVERFHGFLGVMPAYSSEDDVLATKILSFYPENEELPKHMAWILMFQPSTGRLKAIIDGESITAIRTGVASAVATKYLANPHSRILAILGSGVQARSHFKALSLLYSFDEVRIWSRTPSNARKFASEIGATSCSTAEEAVRDADVICTLTFAKTPIIELAWIKPGAHINAVGSCRADWQEVSSEIMRAAIVYCDSYEACKQEAGDVVLSQCEIYAEIGEVINSEKEAHWQKITVFESVGMAIEDAVSAKMVYENYMKVTQSL